MTRVNMTMTSTSATDAGFIVAFVASHRRNNNQASSRRRGGLRHTVDVIYYAMDSDARTPTSSRDLEGDVDRWGETHTHTHRERERERERVNTSINEA